MLSELSPKARRVVRKFFEERGLPLNYENLAKFATGDAEKNIFIFTAVEEGMTQEEAARIYDEISQGVKAQNIPRTDLKGPEVSTADKSAIAEEMQEDFVEAGQVDRLPTEIGQTLPETPKSEDEGDEVSITSVPIDPAKIEGGDEELPYYPDVPDSPLQPFAETPIEEVQSIQERLSGVGLKKDATLPPLLPRDKPAEEFHFGPGAVGVDSVKEGSIEDINKSLDDKAPGLTPEDKVDDAGASLKFANRPSSYPRHTTPVDQVEQGGADVSKKAIDTETVKPPSEADMLNFGLTMQELFQAAADKKPITLDPGQIASIAKVMGPGMLQGLPPNLRDTEIGATEKNKIANLDPEFLEHFKKLDKQMEAALEKTKGRDPETLKRREEEFENLKDSLFAAKAGRPKLDKDYKEALSAIDKKKFLDHVIKGLGQIVSGGIGLGKGLDIGGQFKYDLTDFSGREKALADKYGADIGAINSEVKTLQTGINDFIKNMDKLDADAAKMELDMYQKRASNLLEMLKISKGTSEFGTKFNQMFDGPARELDRIQKLLTDMLGLWVQYNRPVPSTNINVDSSVRTTTGSEIKDEEKVALTTEQLQFHRHSVAWLQHNWEKLRKLDDVRILEELGRNIAGVPARQLVEETGLSLDQLKSMSVTEAAPLFSEALKNRLLNLSKSVGTGAKQTQRDDTTVKEKGARAEHSPRPPLTRPDAIKPVTPLPGDKTPEGGTVLDIRDQAPATPTTTPAPTTPSPTGESLKFSPRVVNGRLVSGFVRGNTLTIVDGKTGELKPVSKDSQEAIDFFNGRPLR